MIVEQGAGSPMVGGKVTVDTTRIPWASRHRRFKANLEAMAVRWPELCSQIAEHWSKVQDRFQLFQVRQPVEGGGAGALADYQILDVQAADASRQWLGGFTDHRKDQEAWKLELTGMQFIMPISFDGVGFGWLLRRVLEATERSALSYSCAVYVLEPDLAAWGLLLHLHDLREVLAGPRLRLFGGPSAAEDFARALRQQKTWTVPQMHCVNLLFERAPLGIQGLCDCEIKARGLEIQAARQRIAEYYRDKDLNYWRSRYEEALAGRTKLRIMGITTRYSTVLQYSMAELRDAIIAAGHECQISMEPDDQSMERTEIALLDEFKPDLLMAISRMRYENPNLPANIPFLCWDQDALPCMRTQQATESLNALTYVAGISAYEAFSSAPGSGKRRWPGWSSIFCQLAAATHRYHAGPVAPDLAQRYACDFSFVSHAAAPPEKFAAQLRGRWASTEWAEVFEAVAARIVAAGVSYEYDHVMLGWAEALAQERQKPLTSEAAREMMTDLRMLADRTTRHTALRWVADYCRARGKVLRLFGNGWDKSPEFAEFAAGPIAPGEDLRALYQHSKINLQIARWGFSHARSLDGVAAGGFFLTCHSKNDYGLDPREREIFPLAERAVELGCWTRAEVEACSDPWIQQNRHKFIGWYSEEEMAKEFSILRIAAWMPLPSLVFDNLADISFADAQEFSRLADRYLGDEDLRRRSAARMREKIGKYYSYDVRWQQFLTAMTQGMRRWGEGTQGV